MDLSCPRRCGHHECEPGLVLALGVHQITNATQKETKASKHLEKDQFWLEGIHNGEGIRGGAGGIGRKVTAGQGSVRHIVLTTPVGH